MTYLLLAIGIGACATPGRQSDEPLVTKPATWTSALMDARKIDPDWVLMQYNTCHPEPAPLPNTILRVWEIATTGSSFHRDILKR